MTVPDLLARASSRVQVRSSDGKSGSIFERVEIDGERYFVKSLSLSTDWIMRITGDHVHRPYLIWQSGIMARAPECIDHTVVAMHLEDSVLTMVMRDVGPWLVPEGDGVVSIEQHAGFIDHLAALSASFWGFEDPGLGLSTMAERVRYFAADNIAAELEVDDVPGPIAAADAGWRELADRSPLLSRIASAVHAHPELVTEPLASTPVTFVHGDWKMGNLGTHPDGRTILLDWAYPGSGPACWDLCWYIALNRTRLPESKEAAIERFRVALEQRGITTEDWWTRQLDLCMIGIMATFGWEKGLGDKAELLWWERRVAEAMARQAITLQ
ncbi:MAG TPA: phosphotransferase [Acidimicrobiales bacterium]